MIQSSPTASSQIRCAAYCRKSNEDGLDSGFSSLDAQREACEAYIQSRRHEGWILLPDVYSDGGYSGANMERPGLQRLLADLAVGRIDVIVCYKLDRLSRSLLDFAKLMELFERHGVSFISITQSFDSRMPMGRLVLHILLSFSEFEREIIGERIRDKIAASKKKGKYMGGTHIVRFKPIPAFATPMAMDELCAAYQRHTIAQDVEPLLLAATFVLDFLSIHPFTDGNGRMARLLTILLLYKSGYEVGRFISLERIIERSRDTYYDALQSSSQKWHEGTHSLVPWWEYFLGVLLAAYSEFEDRVGMVVAGRGAKSAMVRRMVESSIAEFTVSELMHRCPGVSKDLVRAVLDQMKDEGKAECLGRGRFAKWRRIG